jgi:hypothetical protein
VLQGRAALEKNQQQRQVRGDGGLGGQINMNAYKQWISAELRRTAVGRLQAHGWETRRRIVSPILNRISGGANIIICCSSVSSVSEGSSTSPRANSLGTAARGCP